MTRKRCVRRTAICSDGLLRARVTSILGPARKPAIRPQGRRFERRRFFPWQRQAASRPAVGPENPILAESLLLTEGHPQPSETPTRRRKEHERLRRRRSVATMPTMGAVLVALAVAGCRHATSAGLGPRTIVSIGRSQRCCPSAVAPVTHDPAARIHSGSSRPEPPRTRATPSSGSAKHRPSPLARPLLLNLYDPTQVGDREGGKRWQ